MKWFHEKDVEVLRESLANSQSPGGLSSALLFSVPLLWLLYYLVFHLAGEAAIYPNIEKVKEGSSWFLICLTAAIIIFSFKKIYSKFQKTQYVLSIVFSQSLFGISPYMAAIFLVGDQHTITQGSLFSFIYSTLIVGLLIFAISLIRLIILIMRGSYRTGSKKHQTRSKMENSSHIGIAIVSGLSIFYTLHYLIRSFGGVGFLLGDGLMILLGLLLYYAMLFILPEQLAILYCKAAYKSFNFSPISGRLYSIEDVKSGHS